MTVNKKTPKKLRVSRDPDAGLQLKESVVRELREQMSDKNRKLIPMSEVAKRYGFRYVE